MNLTFIFNKSYHAIGSLFTQNSDIWYKKYWGAVDYLGQLLQKVGDILHVNLIRLGAGSGILSVSLQITTLVNLWSFLVNIVHINLFWYIPKWSGRLGFHKDLIFYLGLFDLVLRSLLFLDSF